MHAGIPDGRPRRVLVVKLSSLGDLFHALPAVHEVCRGFGAQIDWVTQDTYVPLVQCFTDVSDVIPFYRASFLRHFGPFLRQLRQRRYDLILDCQGLLKSALVTRLARGGRRIGPSFRREGTGLFYDSVAGPRRRDRHAVEQNLDVVRHLGLEPGPPVFPVAFPARPRSEPHPRVALVPVSRWTVKNWPPACFADVARRLRTVMGASLFLLGGPEDAAACQEVARRIGGQVVNLAGTCTLAETGGLLGQMDLVIANDSGPVHMAAAAGTPCLVVFGPTDPARTGPFGPGHRVVSVALPCRPCFSRVCRREGVPCMSGVTPERVGDVALDMLSKCAR